MVIQNERRQEVNESSMQIHDESNAETMSFKVSKASTQDSSKALERCSNSTFSSTSTLFDSNVDCHHYTNKWTPWNPRVTSFELILTCPYEGKGTEDSPYIVTWLDGQLDAENPLNYPARDKWFLTAFVSISTLCVSLASSAYSGASASIHEHLGGSQILITLGISLYVLGFALGPLLWAPLSETLGRRNSFLISFSVFATCNAIACASPNLPFLLVFRFLSGAFGSSPLTNAGGTIADLFNAKDRGLATALFASCPFAGPALGPIIGGYLGQSAGFRWVMGLLAIYACLMTLVGFLVHSETYAPLLLRRRAEKLCIATGKKFISKLDVGKETSFIRELKLALTRPRLLLLAEPIVLILSLYSAIVYAILYSFFSAFPIVFQQVRGWSPGQGGLAFLGILIGMLMGIMLQIIYFNPAYAKKVDAHGGITAPPEARLPQAIWGAFLLVIGLAGFTATVSPSVHWVAPIIFSVPFGAAMVMSFVATTSYLIDAYLIYAASVLAANSVVRSLMGAIFPLFTPFMYNPGGASSKCPAVSCGIHVGPAIATALALLFLPAPFYFLKHGASIRQRCKYAAEANEILETMLQGSEQDVVSAAPESLEMCQSSSTKSAKRDNQIMIAPTYMPALDEKSELKLQEQHGGSDRCSVARDKQTFVDRQVSQRSQAQEALDRIPSYI